MIDQTGIPENLKLPEDGKIKQWMVAQLMVLVDYEMHKASYHLHRAPDDYYLKSLHATGKVLANMIPEKDVENFCNGNENLAKWFDKIVIEKEPVPEIIDKPN